MYTYYSRKHDAQVYECPACKYKYGKSYTNKVNEYPWGKDNFMKVKDFVNGVTYRADDDWKTTTSNWYICPKCGTMGVVVEVYGREN